SSLFGIARFTATGILDSTFGSGGEVFTDLRGDASANSVALQVDGRIIVAGSLQPDPFQSAADLALVRHNADGTKEVSFDTAGIVTTPLAGFDAAVNKVLIQPDGKILAVGHTSTSSSFFNFAVAR